MSVRRVVGFAMPARALVGLGMVPRLVALVIRVRARVGCVMPASFLVGLAMVPRLLVGSGMTLVRLVMPGRRGFVRSGRRGLGFGRSARVVASEMLVRRVAGSAMVGLVSRGCPSRVGVRW